METCLTCIYVAVEEKQCRKNPPVAIQGVTQLGQVQLMGIYPPIDVNTYCVANIKN